MAGQGGAIVNISSRAAQIGGAGEWVHYAASKGALDTFTLGLAREVAAEGIRVNAVAPGHVLTELHATSGDPETDDAFGSDDSYGTRGNPGRNRRSGFVAALAGGVLHNGSDSSGKRRTITGRRCRPADSVAGSTNQPPRRRAEPAPRPDAPGSRRWR